MIIVDNAIKIIQEVKKRKTHSSFRAFKLPLLSQKLLHSEDFIFIPCSEYSGYTL